jgi:hypothetical protein
LPIDALVVRARDAVDTVAEVVRLALTPRTSLHQIGTRAAGLCTLLAIATVGGATNVFTLSTLLASPHAALVVGDAGLANTE